MSIRIIDTYEYIFFGSNGNWLSSVKIMNLTRFLTTVILLINYLGGSNKKYTYLHNLKENKFFI